MHWEKKDLRSLTKENWSICIGANCCRSVRLPLALLCQGYAQHIFKGDPKRL